MFPNPRSEGASLKNIHSLLIEFLKRFDYRRITFEQRPIKRFRNVVLQRRHIAPPNGFYIGVEADSVILVYENELIEYKFDNVDMLQSQIKELEALGIQRIDFVDGITKALFLIAVFVVLLQFVIWLTN